MNRLHEAYDRIPAPIQDDAEHELEALREVVRHFYESGGTSQPFEYSREEVRAQLARGNLTAMNNFWASCPGGYRRWWEDYAAEMDEETMQLHAAIDSSITELGLDATQIEELARKRCLERQSFDAGLSLRLQQILLPVFEHMLDKGFNHHALIT